MYNLIDNELENTIVLIDAMNRNWSIEILFLKNNHHWNGNPFSNKIYKVLIDEVCIFEINWFSMSFPMDFAMRKLTGL
ncbi:hypothetical protein E9535_14685 [Listeria monocytogenes]|nr:hypothetical protein [Listeria monocytogenes]